MAKLKLGIIEDNKPVKLTLEIPAALHRDLMVYGELLGRETGSVALDPTKLITPMLAHFIAADRAFAKARRTLNQLQAQSSHRSTNPAPLPQSG